MKLSDIKGRNIIVVNNPRRIKRLLGISTRRGIYLTNIEEAKEFINKYKNLLFSYNPQDLRELENTSGLIATHIIRTKDSNSQVFYFNSSCACTNNLFLKSQNYFDHDIIVETFVDELSISFKDNKTDIYINKEKIDDFNKSFPDILHYVPNKLPIYLTKNFEINFLCKTIDEKVEYINKCYKCDLESKNIKEIKVDYFSNFLILYNDGKLYRNNILYDENIEYVLNIDDYNTYLIYKDNHIGMYSSKNVLFWEITKKYKKILYKDDCFLARINKEKILELEVAVDNFHEASIAMTFDNIDDINYNYYELDDNNWNEKLELISNESTISIDLLNNVSLEINRHEFNTCKESEEWYPWNHVDL